LSPVCLQARHTGIKIVQQIAILIGCAVLPHLRQMVDIIEHGLTDEQQKVKPALTRTCLIMLPRTARGMDTLCVCAIAPADVRSAICRVT
jgi:hypothetical protein